MPIVIHGMDSIPILPLKLRHQYGQISMTNVHPDCSHFKSRRNNDASCKGGGGGGCGVGCDIDCPLEVLEYVIH